MNRSEAAGAGALGPRLPGRLTAELVLRSPQYMSCIGLYHLDLRGNRIGAIENLGATQNQFDCIDLSDNNLIRLEGFPQLGRLRMLMCCNNRIESLAPGLHGSLPALDTLILTNNKVDRLTDLDALSSLSKLTHLSLVDNPIEKQKEFRLYAIHTLKHLKVLNFKKIKETERDAAREKYLNLTMAEVQQQAAQQAPVMLVEDAKNGDDAQPTEMTDEQRMALQVAITNAATLEEVHRLESALKVGRMPELHAGTEGMDEG